MSGGQYGALKLPMSAEILGPCKYFPLQGRVYEAEMKRHRIVTRVCVYRSAVGAGARARAGAGAALATRTAFLVSCCTAAKEAAGTNSSDRNSSGRGGSSRGRNLRSRVQGVGQGGSLKEPTRRAQKKTPPPRWGL